MGICLDTNANATQDIGDQQETDWKRAQDPAIATREAFVSGEISSIQNAGKIKFDPPKVPVIFVLGGPGSGKVSHSDTFMQERRGVVHINMMDLLQQFAMGNDLQDFSQLSSKTVTEVLMLEMKMAPAAKAYLISGYPRSMRDVVEYSEKIQVVNGVILISWRQSVLQKQIDYGAKLGHVVLSLAKMELENFFKNVMPVADYFDQSDMLIAVNGERAPLEVYKDFRIAVLDILNALENQEAILNGVTGMGRGMNDIPGSIVSVDTAPSQEKNITGNAASPENAILTNQLPLNVSKTIYSTDHNNETNQEVQSETSSVIRRDAIVEKFPPIIWVIGGPGSNKSSLCLKAVRQNIEWGHISVGLLLRTITDSAPRANTESYEVKEALSAGDLAPEKVVNSHIENNLRQMLDKEGILIDGYPRSLKQVEYFEYKYKQRPPIVLLDCSKLQLGRGRIDDTVSSFRRRLEIFREHTLPMLKSMDNSARLQIIDGDTDSPSVQREFEKVIRGHIQNFKLMNKNKNHNAQTNRINKEAMNDQKNENIILHDLENNVSGVVPSISHHVSLMNGHLRNNHKNDDNLNRSQKNTKALGGIVASTKSNLNGDIQRQPMNFRHMLEEAEKYPVDSYI